MPPTGVFIIGDLLIVAERAQVGSSVPESESESELRFMVSTTTQVVVACNAGESRGRSTLKRQQPTVPSTQQEVPPSGETQFLNLCFYFLLDAPGTLLHGSLKPRAR